MRKASASSLQASQRVLWWYLFLTDRWLQMLWKMLQTIHWWSPFTQNYHWNHPEISVTSVTSSPRLWSMTISGNFSSYDDIACRLFKHSVASAGNRQLALTVDILSNSISHRLNRVCTTLWLSSERLSALNYTNCVIYIDFISIST